VRLAMGKYTPSRCRTHPLWARSCRYDRPEAERSKASVSIRYAKRDHRQRALRLLAGCPDGSTESILLAHGFSLSLLAELVRDGLATATMERVGRGKKIKVVCLRITEAGRKAMK
jgi:hypothetical protein